MKPQFCAPTVWKLDSCVILEGPRCSVAADSPSDVLRANELWLEQIHTRLCTLHVFDLCSGAQGHFHQHFCAFPCARVCVRARVRDAIKCTYSRKSVLFNKST